MDLLDRYLQAVRTYLPRSQQDDILRELSENLRAQMEDKESELGRALSEAEVADMLKKHGHPLVVATRYRQSRHLIGSTLFPYYWFAVKIILAIVGFGYAIGALALIAQGKPIVEVFGALFNFIGAVLPTFAWVTIVFAVLDLTNAKFHLLEKFNKECNEKFDPRSLPEAKVASSSPEGKPIPRSMTVFELFFSVAFLLWWIRVSPIRKLALFIALGPIGLADKIPFEFGPVWTLVYVPVILLALAAIAQQIITLMYPDQVAFYAGARLVTNLFSLVLLYLLASAHDLLVIAPTVQNAARFLDPLRIVNQVLHYTLLFAMIITAVECFKQVRRLFRIRKTIAESPAS